MADLAVDFTLSSILFSSMLTFTLKKPKFRNEYVPLDTYVLGRIPLKPSNKNVWKQYP